MSARKRVHRDIDASVEKDVDYDTLDAPSAQLMGEMRGSKRSRTARVPHLDIPARDQSLGVGKTSKKSPSSPHQGRIRSMWSSRFLEGSMNDKPSKKPPNDFIGDEHLVERYMAGDDSKDTPTSMDTNLTYDAGIHTTRPSSMYRFGKAIANAFTGIWKDKPVEQTQPERDMLEERRIEAEETYLALKGQGFPGIQSTSNLEKTLPRAELDTTSRFSRDSAIDVDGYRSSADRKRDGMILNPDDVSKVLQAAPLTSRSVSQVSEATSRSSVSIRRRSFTSLKKVKSHLQLPPSQRSSSMAPPTSQVASTKRAVSMTPSPSVESDFPREQNPLRKQISKKDLQKQQKLSKKLSDLESQMEKTRRQLQEVGGVPPVPALPSHITSKTYVPGLASLPSERLLNGYLDQPAVPEPRLSAETAERVLEFLEGTDSNASDGPPVPRSFPLPPQRTSSRKPSEKPLPKTPKTEERAIPSKENPIAPASKKVPSNAPKENVVDIIEIDDDSPGPELVTLAPQKTFIQAKSQRKLSGDKKRKGRGGSHSDYVPSDDDDEDYVDGSAGKKRGRPLKAQKTDHDSSPASSKGSMKENLAPRTGNHASPRSSGRASKPTEKKQLALNSPQKTSTASTPTTKPHKPFNPTIIDRSQLLAMRSNPTNTAPFGELSEDVINLRKAYPILTNEEAIRYVSSSLNSFHPLRRTSHQVAAPGTTRMPEQRPTPTLRRPRSTSPNKRVYKLSPPPSMEYMSMRSGNPMAEKEDEPVKISPKKNKNVPAVPKILSGVEGVKAQVKKEEDEDFQWDDDVF